MFQAHFCIRPIQAYYSSPIKPNNSPTDLAAAPHLPVFSLSQLFRSCPSQQLQLALPSLVQSPSTQAVMPCCSYHSMSLHTRTPKRSDCIPARQSRFLPSPAPTTCSSSSKQLNNFSSSPCNPRKLQPFFLFAMRQFSSFQHAKLSHVLTSFPMIIKVPCTQPLPFLLHVSHDLFIPHAPMLPVVPHQSCTPSQL